MILRVWYVCSSILWLMGCYNLAWSVVNILIKGACFFICTVQLRRKAQPLRRCPKVKEVKLLPLLILLLWSPMPSLICKCLLRANSHHTVPYMPCVNVSEFSHCTFLDSWCESNLHGFSGMNFPYFIGNCMVGLNYSSPTALEAASELWSSRVIEFLWVWKYQSTRVPC